MKFCQYRPPLEKILPTLMILYMVIGDIWNECMVLQIQYHETIKQTKHQNNQHLR